MNVSVSHIIIYVFFLIFGIFGLFNAPRIWNGWFDRREALYHGQLVTHSEIVEGWWPAGPRGWRAALHASVPMLCFWWGMALVIFVGGVDDHLHGVAREAGRGIFLAVSALTLASTAFIVIVMLFNWPKFIVPPYLRDEPGLIAVRRSRQRTP